MRRFFRELFSAKFIRPKTIAGRILVAVFSLHSLSVIAAPLTLDDAVHAALRQNQSIKVQLFSTGIARANLLTAEGQFDPVIRFDQSHTDSPYVPNVANLLALGSTRVDSYSLSLNGTTPWGLNFSLGGN